MAETRLYLKPAEGRIVPLPSGEPCPPGGAYWDNTLYTRRRIADGDLIKAKPPAETAVAAPETKRGAEK